MSDRQSGEPPFLRVLSSLPVIQSYDFAARYATPHCVSDTIRIYFDRYVW